MRTSIDIDKSILAEAKKAAQARGSTPGAVLSEWARIGRRQRSSATRSSGLTFPVFKVPSKPRSLTMKTVSAIVKHEGLST